MTSKQYDSNDEDETLTCIIIRTSDAMKVELTLPLSKKLGELKTILADEKYFGPIPVDHQRIFHLGREWKSQGRSLYKLGLGRFNNRVIHLQIRPDVNTLKAPARTQRRIRAVPEVKNNSVIELLDDSDDEVEVSGVNKRSRLV